MILDLMRKRVSVRKFRDQPISEDVLREILEAGRLSPSGGNEQPWRFGVDRERALIESIAAASYGQDWIAGAPLVIVLCVVVTGDERGGRGIQKQRFPRHQGAIEVMDGDLYAALSLEVGKAQLALARSDVRLAEADAVLRGLEGKVTVAASLDGVR